MNDQTAAGAQGATLERTRIVASVLAVLAGIVGFYVLHAQAAWLRWLSVLAGIVLAAVVFGTSAQGRAFWRFMQDARLELRKVVWPNRQETATTTAVVFGFVIITGLFFWVLDVFLSWATRMLTGQGGG
jgi:preprotein translocase subunit SecE